MGLHLLSVTDQASVKAKAFLTLSSEICWLQFPRQLSS